MIVLVDTCVWSLAFRRSRHDIGIRAIRTLRLLEEIILEGRVQMLGLVRQELLSGIRHKSQFDRVVAATRNFSDAVLETEDHEEAAVVANRCRSAGIVGSSIDYLLCAVAMRRDWGIMTTDRDFAHYQKHVPFTLIPALAPGP